VALGVNCYIPRGISLDHEYIPENVYFSISDAGYIVGWYYNCRKKLSSKSNQGNREFVNEIGMISALQHPNLVRLYGCCVEGNQLFLVYEYMENNSLARALFGKLYFHFRILC